MKRKLLQFTQTTQAVTIPRAWAKQLNLKKGEELNVEERGSELIISTERSIPLTAELNLAGVNPDLIWRLFIAAYKRGMHKLIITYEGEESLQIIQRYIGDVIGWTVTEQTLNKVIVEDLNPAKKEDIDNMIEKAFSFLILISQSTIAALQTMKQEKIDAIRHIDFNINRYTNLALRTLNRTGYPRSDKVRSLYLIAALFEEIGDEYRRTAKHYLPNLHKIGPNIIKGFEKVNNMIEELKEIYYNYTNENLADYHKKLRTVFEDLMKIPHPKTATEGQILASLFTIFHLIKSINEENIVIHTQLSEPTLQLFQQ